VREQPFPEDWYDLGDASHFWFRWRQHALARLLADVRAPIAEPLDALDVGCGAGVLAAQLEGATSWTVDGVDLNLPALERCGPRRGQTLYYDVTEERAELLGRYGVALVFDVLEHLEEPRTFVASVLRHLRPGGLLLVNVPALPFLTSHYDLAAGHLRRYTRRSLEAELAVHGLERRALRYWGLSLVPLLLARKAAVAGGGPETLRRGFRPPFPFVNAALSRMARVETALLPSPGLGTSVLYAGVKPAGRS
jgi:SAM-dependent methyltransferase